VTILDSYFRRAPVVFLGRKAGRRKDLNKEVGTRSQENIVERGVGARAAGNQRDL
jgi:hypothetical protein